MTFWGENSVCGVASSLFFQQRAQTFKETQNKTWMGTGRRSTHDNHAFENIVKNALENPWNLTENLLENPGKEFHFTVGHPDYACRIQSWNP